jgi:hypothetical protein
LCYIQVDSDDSKVLAGLDDVRALLEKFLPRLGLVVSCLKFKSTESPNPASIHVVVKRGVTSPVIYLDDALLCHTGGHRGCVEDVPLCIMISILGLIQQHLMQHVQSSVGLTDLLLQLCDEGRKRSAVRSVAVGGGGSEPSESPRRGHGDSFGGDDGSDASGDTDGNDDRERVGQGEEGGEGTAQNAQDGEDGEAAEGPVHIMYVSQGKLVHLVQDHLPEARAAKRRKLT